MFRLWCEYDYGQDDAVFGSEESARRWLYDAVKLADDGMLSHQLFADGLASIQPVTFIA